MPSEKLTWLFYGEFSTVYFSIRDIKLYNFSIDFLRII